VSVHKTGDAPETIRFRSPVKQQGWAQVYHALTLDTELSDGAFRLYVLLLKYARQSGSCWPGVERLARDLGKAKSTVKARLAELTRRGLITRGRRLGTSSVTWIEDLEQVYGGSENRTFEQPENRPTKGQKIGRHEGHAGKNIQHAGDGDLSSEQHITKRLLTDFGVDPVVARWLARKCTVGQVRGWIAHTNRRRQKLRDPVAFLVSRLKSGEPPPESSSSADHANRRRHGDRSTLSMTETCKCGRIVPDGYLCPDCRGCPDCCKCEEDGAEPPSDP
jgi:hypothetical protein